MREGPISLPLELRRPVPALGVQFVLAGRTHKELAGPHPEVHGVWDLRVEREGAAPLEEHVVGTSLYAEGSGLGVSWVLRGEYDQEKIHVWRGETPPLSETARRARASTAAGAATNEDDWPKLESETNGVYTADFARSAGTTRVRIGLYTGKVLAVEVVR